MTSDDYEREGRSWLMRGDAETALKFFQEGLVKFPGNEDLLLGLGMTHNALGNYAQACEVLEPIYLRHPRWSDVAQGLAEACLPMGKHKKALVFIERATAEHEKDAEFINTLAVLLFEYKLYREAVSVHRKALVRDPNHAPAHMGIGVSLHRLGETDAAIAALRKATAVAPSFWEAWSYLGNLLFDKRKKSEALKAWVSIPVEHMHDLAAVNRLLGMSKGPEHAERRKALKARRADLEKHRAAQPRQDVGAVVERLEDDMDEASLARHPRAEGGFWRGLLTILDKPEVHRLGSELDRISARIFAKPADFASGELPRLVRFDIKLGERFLVLLGEFLDEYPWVLDLTAQRHGIQCPEETSEPDPLLSEEDELRLIESVAAEISRTPVEERRRRGAMNIFEWSGVGDLMVAGLVIVRELRRRVAREVFPHVAIVKLRESMERLKAHVPLKSIYYEAWVQLRAELEPQ